MEGQGDIESDVDEGPDEGREPDETGRAGAGTDESYALPRRSAFAPSFFVILALALATLAIQPTRELSYELFGPAASVDLGGPGEYRLELAKDGARVRIEGLLSPQYARYTVRGDTFEVRNLLGTPVLVQRAPRRIPLGKDEVERFVGEGRLVELADAPSTYFERLVRPDARFDKLREKFEQTGEILPDDPQHHRPAYLLVAGDLPRAHAGAVLLPVVLWLLALASLGGAAWSAKTRRRALEARRRLARALYSE